jgi:hypothetical protein
MDDGPRTSDATRESGRTLAQEIIEAYGGMKRWNRVSSLRVDIALCWIRLPHEVPEESPVSRNDGGRTRPATCDL